VSPGGTPSSLSPNAAALQLSILEEGARTSEGDGLAREVQGHAGLESTVCTA